MMTQYRILVLTTREADALQQILDACDAGFLEGSTVVAVVIPEIHCPAYGLAEKARIPQIVFNPLLRPDQLHCSLSAIIDSLAVTVVMDCESAYEVPASVPHDFAGLWIKVIRMSEFQIAFATEAALHASLAGHL